MKLALALIPTLLAAEKTVTFHKDVEPILQARCQSCHRPGEAAPMSLLTYAQARPWAKAMKAAVLAKKMPPWFASEDSAKMAHEPKLSKVELDLLTRWADTGAAEGEMKDAPKPLVFTDGWAIGKPDLILEVPNSYMIPAKGTIDYQWVVMPAGFKEDRWIKAMELRPGNRAVVHHIVMCYREAGSKWLTEVPAGTYISKPVSSGETGSCGGLIGAYPPGWQSKPVADDAAFLLPAGSDLVLQMHYTASGKEESDRSRVGIIFAKEPPKRRMVFAGTGAQKMLIPPRAENFRVDAEFEMNEEARLVDITPHMHLRGKSFEMYATYPDGRKEMLIRVPRWDFNWQLTYELAEVRVLPKGTRLHATGWFDNSANNPNNPNPDVEVRRGDQTWDEMMVGGVSLSVSMDANPRKLFKQVSEPYQEKPKSAATGAEQ